jgi:hypothetical protein
VERTVSSLRASFRSYLPPLTLAVSLLYLLGKNDSTNYTQGKAMDFLGIFRDFDLALISKCMIVELAIGVVVGFTLKQVAKISANRTSNLQVISSNEYTSPHFAKSFPRHAFDIFQLPPEFVIVQSVNDRLISEDFYTSLGSSTKVFYENEEYRGYGYSALTTWLSLYGSYPNCCWVLPCSFTLYWQDF